MINNVISSSGENLTFGFLSTIDAPLLPLMITFAIENGCKHIVVICDAKISSEKDKQIWIERTNGVFESNPYPNIYNLGKSIPFYFVENHNSEQTIHLIKYLKIDCLVNAGTPRKLSTEILSSVKHGVVNVHPGLLPAYRGCSCVEWAIFNDDKVGNTAHFMDEGYDTGPIITSESYTFSEDADYQSIRIKVYREGCALVGKVLASIQEKKLLPSDCITQELGSGKYWSPIPENIMLTVYEKIKNKQYKYQLGTEERVCS